MNARNAPRAAVPDAAESVSTAVSVGPMQGDQPTPNITPSSGAPASPALGCADGRKIRPANENRSNAPANIRPSRIVIPPRIWVSPVLCVLSNWPRPPTARPYTAKTSENPTTNSAVPATARPLAGVAGPVTAARVRVVTAPPSAAAAAVSAAPVPSSASVPAAALPAAPAPDIPVMYDRYPGTSGRQHGDRNVTAPAAAATGIASSSGPDVTRFWTLIPAACRGLRGWR